MGNSNLHIFLKQKIKLFKINAVHNQRRGGSFDGINPSCRANLYTAHQISKLNEEHSQIRNKTMQPLSISITNEIPCTS